VEESVAEGNGHLVLDGVRGLTQRQLDHGPLDELVGRLLRDLT
jgi:hypothetical protein